MRLDSTDLTRLYDGNAAMLLAFFSRRTFEPEAAVDLLAETFAVAFADRRQFRGADDEAARAWLYGIARRRLTDFYRRGYAEQRALARLGVDRRPLTDEEYDRIEELAASRQLREAVAGALAGLPAQDREVLQQRVIEERSYHEIAAGFGITEQTARARVSRALRSLRQTPALAHVMEETHV
jgi:RNA polymerase sigma factor (sigma-70 family)